MSTHSSCASYRTHTHTITVGLSSMAVSNILFVFYSTGIADQIMHSYLVEQYSKITLNLKNCLPTGLNSQCMLNYGCQWCHICTTHKFNCLTLTNQLIKYSYSIRIQSNNWANQSYLAKYQNTFFGTALLSRWTCISWLPLDFPCPFVPVLCIFSRNKPKLLLSFLTPSINQVNSDKLPSIKYKYIVVTVSNLSDASRQRCNLHT